jgi:uncharacterized protein
MDTKDLHLELKSLDETGIFEGRLSVYDIVDEGGDVVERGAFTKTLSEGNRTIPLLWAHDTQQPIGTLELHDSPTALMAKGRLVLDVPKAKEAYALMKAGALRGLSIGYKVIKQIPGDSVRRLKELRLYEGSLVSTPMNLQAVITGVKQQGGDVDNDEALQAFRNASRDLKDFYERVLD